MKYIKLSDAVFQTQDLAHRLPQANIYFCVNRKRKPSKKQSMAEQKGLYQILECIASDHYRAISGEIRLLTDKENTLKKLGIDSIQKLAGYCNAYYLPQLKQELAELETIGVISRTWHHAMDDLLNNELGERFKQGKTFVLRLGKHGGAISKTLDGLRAIHIPQQNHRIAEEPTTVWLAAKRIKDSTDLYPFGWVIVELEDNNDIKALKELLETNTQALRKRFAEEYQQQLQQQQQQEQQARRQKEQADKEAAIAAAQAREKELAAVTEGLSELATTFATRKIEE
jgi:CRISPR-associated protein Csm5